jgi:hypothetical protein
MSSTYELDKFYDFLITNNCLDNYLALEHAAVNIRRDSLRDISDIISTTAIWCTSVEGDEYWLPLASQWVKVIKASSCNISVNEVLNYLKNRETVTSYEFW